MLDATRQRTNLPSLAEPPHIAEASHIAEPSHIPVVGAVRRRRVIYVEGYDPRGAEVYHHLFARACERFGKAWPVSLTLKPIEIDSEELAHWSLEMRSANWQVATRYDFLRLEHHIRADMGGSLTRQIWRGLTWIADDFVSGTQWRIFNASWQFGAHLLFIQVLFLLWLALAAASALAAFRIVTIWLDEPVVIGIVAAILVAPAALLALRPLAQRWFVGQITNCWATLRRFGRGQKTWIDQAVEAGARHLVAVAQRSDADEIVVVGHSTGSVIATAIVARALALDPHLGRKRARLTLLTLGSVMPAVALHPAASRMRDIVKRLAIEPTLNWVECQCRKDVMNFAAFDPVEDIGLHIDGQHIDGQHNPKIWLVRFQNMISPAEYRRLRWSFFRMHFQYIMSGDRQTAHDYVLLVGGPMALADWANRHDLALIRDGMVHSPNIQAS
jgi:pimeloyl-ACP methyl ester carboxylesterase